MSSLDGNQNVMKKKIVLTGGGTAGHVMPNLALLPALREKSFEVSYIGSNGVERTLVESAHIPFYEISTGKLRRYFSVQNFLDIFRILKGIFDALTLLRQIRPNVVFSKGGFVAVPVAMAAWMLRIPVVSHESDYSPGLANRIIARFANRILYTFKETGSYLPASKGQLVGTPVRAELFAGKRERGLAVCGFADAGLPIVLVMGGSQGAQRLNETLREILPDVLTRYRVVHLTGKGKTIDYAHEGYRAFEFLSHDLSHVFAICDAVVCRAGANSIFEMLALRKPMLLIPLQIGSRGDQVLNARSFVAQGWAHVLMELEMTPETLQSAVDVLMKQSIAMKEVQERSQIGQATDQIVGILLKLSA